MGEDVTYQILLVGLDELSREVVESLCTEAFFTRIQNSHQFESSYEAWTDGMFHGVIAGPSCEGLSPIEIGQVLQSQCPSTPRLFVGADRSNYEPKSYLKNGFLGSFLLPLDRLPLEQEIKEKVLVGAKRARAFRSVRVFDFDDQSAMDFDTYVYLPLNRKHVRFSGMGETMDVKKQEKLKEKSVSHLYVDQKDIAKFQKHAAQKLLRTGGEESLTQRQEKLSTAVRGLFQDMFDVSIKSDFDAGKALIAQAEGIISNYVTKGSTGHWYNRLMSTVGEAKDAYSHTSNVATFGALFALGVGHMHPEDLAMAGLFHDLGMAELPLELQLLSDDAVPSEQQASYFSHPERSVNIAKGKRIILPAAVEKAILQHHERFSGGGFPKGLAAHRISEEAQILHFADQFDYLTSFREGQRRRSPMEAFDEIKSSGRIDPELLLKIRKLLETKGAA